MKGDRTLTMGGIPTNLTIFRRNYPACGVWPTSNTCLPSSSRHLPNLEEAKLQTSEGCLTFSSILRLRRQKATSLSIKSSGGACLRNEEDAEVKEMNLTKATTQSQPGSNSDQIDVVSSLQVYLKVQRNFASGTYCPECS